MNIGAKRSKAWTVFSCKHVFKKNSKDSTGGGLNPHNPPLGTTAYSSLVSLEEFKVNPNVNLPPEHAHTSADLIFCMLNLFLTFS